MITFLKRRWILLSWALMLAACSVFDLERVSYSDMHGEGAYYLEAHGLYRGYFRSLEGVVISDNPQFGWRFATHRPQFGDLPERTRTVWTTSSQVPIWCPLAVIFGWMLIGELRWRENRAKAAETQPPT